MDVRPHLRERRWQGTQRDVKGLTRRALSAPRRVLLQLAIHDQAAMCRASFRKGRIRAGAAMH